VYYSTPSLRGEQRRTILYTRSYLNKRSARKMGKKSFSMYGTDAPGMTKKKAKKSKVLRKVFKSSVASGSVVKQEVARQVDRLIEDKTIQYTWTQQGAVGLVPYGSATWDDYNICPIFPVSVTPGFVISQGSGQGNRIGNSIRPTKFVYRGVLSANQWNGTYNNVPQPQYVMLLLLARKDTGNQVIGTTSLLYQNGSSATNPTGALYDVLAPFNEDLYNVHYKRVFKIGSAINQGGGAEPNQQQYANNDFSRAVMFNVDLTKYYYKAIKFNDATLLANVSQGLHLAWYVMNGDGTTQSLLNAPVQLTSVMSLTYKDG